MEQLSPKKRYGHAVPRLYTPEARPLVPEIRDGFGTVIQEATTWGYSAIQFAEEILELELFPWQRWLLLHLLELNEHGGLRFQTGVVLIARQNGKSTLSQVLSLWFMVVQKWPLVLGTAQDLNTAEEVWEGGVALLQNDPELNALIERVIQVNGKKTLVLTDPDRAPDEKKRKLRWLVKAANRKAGRGLSGNLILMDELREQQNWAAWSAITKTTQAQDNLLILALSNAGDATSVVLRHLRTKAHIALGDPDGIAGDALMDMSAPSPLADDDYDDDEFDDDDVFEDDLEVDGATIFLAEWSAAPGTPTKNQFGWAQANPSLGHRIRLAKLRNDEATDTEWGFRTEVLCQWTDSILDGPFPSGSWELGQNNIPPEEYDVLPNGDMKLKKTSKYRLVGDLYIGIDQSMDRSMVYIAVGGRRRDGKAQIEVWAARSGTDWVKKWLMEEKRLTEDGRRPVKVIGQTSKGAPVAPLMHDLIEARENKRDPFRLDVEKWEGGDLMLASAEMFDAVRDVEVFHNPQPPLDLAAGTGQMKQLGDGFVLDRRNSMADVAPLMAFCGVLWLMSHVKPKTKRSSLPPETISDGDSDEGTVTGDLMDVQW